MKRIKTILLVSIGAIAAAILYFVGQGNGGFSVIFGFVGLAVAVSSRRFLAERNRARATAMKRV
jgi:hypothetical protein